MEKTTIIGIVLGFACTIIGILVGEGGNVMNFWDPASIFITLGGTIAATVASYPGKILKTFGLMYRTAFTHRNIDLQKDIDMIIDIANIARREGLLALEDAVMDIDNPFFKKGIMLVVDGADPELIKNILEAEIYFIQDRHGQGQAAIESMASYAPAFGMVGTLIGLINMLKNLDDPGALGPGMSVALVTTFYGVILANLVFNPIAKKLKANTAAETMQKELLMEGLLSIQDGENPRIIKDKLHSFIARRNIADDDQKAGLKNETAGIDDE